jgi:hypothetical protein
MNRESLDDLKRRVRETVEQERRESGRVLEQWTQTVAGGNGLSAWPREQAEPLLTRQERIRLRRDLEARGMAISPFLDRLLRDGV